MPSMRTELTDGTITIRAYQPGIEWAVSEAAWESLREIGPSMRTWPDGAAYEKTAWHVASIEAWQAGTSATWFRAELCVHRDADARCFRPRAGHDSNVRKLYHKIQTSSTAWPRRTSTPRLRSLSIVPLTRCSENIGSARGPASARMMGALRGSICRYSAGGAL